MNKKFLIGLLIMVVGIVGYFSYFKSSQEIETKTPGGLEIPPPSQDVCSFIKNSTFRSSVKMAGGMDPKIGYATSSYWTLRFSGDLVMWNYTDIVESGTYSCWAGTVEAIFGGRAVGGSYNDETGVLTWDGVKYIRK